MTEEGPKVQDRDPDFPVIRLTILHSPCSACPLQLWLPAGCIFLKGTGGGLHFHFRSPVQLGGLVLFFLLGEGVFPEASGGTKEKR